MPRWHPIHNRTLIPSDGDLCPSRPSSWDKLHSPSISDSSYSTLESERSDAGIEDTKLHRNSPEPSVNRNTAKPTSQPIESSAKPSVGKDKTKSTSKAVGGFFPSSTTCIFMAMPPVPTKMQPKVTSARRDHKFEHTKFCATFRRTKSELPLDLYASTSKAACNCSAPNSLPWPMGRKDWHGLELDIGDSELRATADLPHIKESRNGKQSIQMKQKSVKKSGKKSVKKSVKSVKKSTKMQKMVINIMKNMAKKRGRGTGRPEKGKPKNVKRLDKGLKEVQSEVRSMSGAQLPRDASAVMHLALGVFGVNIFTFMVAVFLLFIVLWLFSQQIWGPITEEERYRAKMRKSGVALKSTGATVNVVIVLLILNFVVVAVPLAVE
ncbi:uncharacterized protein LOC121405477 [Drosophila obscura]|uniref:uncharacterized protein LOC121405477 n=1 Tax=Drosophila obscura TaxID=7282 RepID=UPI001BB26F97|nr:uncharacterized protein LOC121405477 [Drosophila obscura]